MLNNLSSYLGSGASTIEINCSGVWHKSSTNPTSQTRYWFGSKVKMGVDQGNGHEFELRRWCYFSQTTVRILKRKISLSRHHFASKMWVEGAWVQPHAVLKMVSVVKMCAKLNKIRIRLTRTVSDIKSDSGIAFLLTLDLLKGNKYPL